MSDIPNHLSWSAKQLFSRKMQKAKVQIFSPSVITARGCGNGITARLRQRLPEAAHQSGSANAIDGQESARNAWLVKSDGSFA